MDSTTSTNDVAKKLAKTKSDDFVVQADEQTSGRGRKDRDWLSPKGGLYFTICTDYEPLLSIKAGIAIARALEDLDVQLSLKWPNDVLVNDKKICGVLTEINVNRALVGIGLNLDSEPIDDSISMKSVTDKKYSPEDLMKSILKYFYDRAINILKKYRQYSSTIGKNVRVETEYGTITGKVNDIDEKGRLVLDDGTKVISGDVIHLRPSNRKPTIKK
ncbi:MAG: biotin--[acetyl-CoA-carboxylase] ligase [Candidatus Saliniplasma sp.]